MMTEKNLLKRHPLAMAIFVAANCAPMALAASSSLVISQVYGGGGNSGAIYKNDFIEVFNRGGSAVNLAGYSVQYASSTGTTWAKTNLGNVTLQPGQYYLVQEAAGTGGTTNLPTPDVIGSLALSGTTGKVALVSNQTVLAGSCPGAANGVVDFVGFGAANCSETSPVAALTNTTAAQRAANGCTETDNNSSDFSTGAPNPRNTATALNQCGGKAAIAVNLSVSANAGSEAGATVITVTATAAAPVTGSQTVSLNVTGTGITAGDYTLSNSLITIPDGGSMGTVSFTVVDDTLVEGTETAVLSLASPSAGLVLGATSSQNIVITDNDHAPGTACGDPATKISAVQGSGGATPLSGVAGTSIEGIVIGDYQGDSSNSLRGYFVQEEDIDADGNPATSEGIFVFDGTNGVPDVHVGDRVRVTGTPAEFFNMTQMATLTDVQVCAVGQVLPTPAVLTLPVPNVPNGDLTLATAAVNSYYEAFEGMLVTIPATLKVSEYFELERYGQLVLSQGGRIPTFTAVNNPGASGLVNQQIALAKRQIILDDGNNSQNFYISSYATANNIPLPYPGNGLSITNRFRGGDSISNLTGVLHWSFAGFTGTDAWRIRPVKEVYNYDFTPANPRKPNAPDVGGNLKIAGSNLLNYFSTIDTTASNSSGPCGPDGIQDCRGADSAAEFARQTSKAAAALCGINADIFGLLEVQNDTTATMNALVGALNAVNGCGPYAYVNTGTIGGDAIKPVLMYKTTTVSPTGAYQLLTSSVDPRFVDSKNRPALAQTFTQTATGEKLTIAVNHLKSKGSACTDLGDADLNDGQGNCNLTRKNAALALVDWLKTDPTNSGDPDYLIIGDLNSYAKEDPIKAIENGGDDIANTADDYVNLIKAFGGDTAYSYVFDGQTGYLDHALANKSLLPQITAAADWHINSDEPPSFDYNDTIQDTGEASFEAKPAALPLYAADQYRTSDHDPVVIGLQLGETINIIDGGAAKNILNGTSGKDRMTGLGGADTLTGGLNADEFVYRSVTDGIDTIADFTPGEDKIVLTALLQSLGYQGNDPLADGIIKFAASGNNTLLYIDADGTGPEPQRALILVLGVSVGSLGNAANFVF